MSELLNPGTLPPSLTLEKLRSAHGPVPGDPLLAEPMYLARYIERMGTGIGDMIRRCKEAGLPEPECTVTDGFRTIVRRVHARGPGEETSEKILAMIRRQPEITIQEIAGALGISKRAVEMQLAKLKESGKLQRFGPAKGGHWKVLE